MECDIFVLLLGSSYQLLQRSQEKGLILTSKIHNPLNCVEISCRFHQKGFYVQLEWPAQTWAILQYLLSINLFTTLTRVSQDCSWLFIDICVFQTQYNKRSNAYELFWLICKVCIVYSHWILVRPDPRYFGSTAPIWAILPFG